MSSYIKLYRKIAQWEWYKDGDTARLFFHLLIKAERFGKSERGVKISPGQVLTTERQLAEELGYKWPNHRQTIRTALSHLKATNEITTQATKVGTLITVENYAEYQGANTQPNHSVNHAFNHSLTAEQPKPNQSLTNLPIIREMKESKEIREGREWPPVDNFNDRLEAYKRKRNIK